MPEGIAMRGRTDPDALTVYLAGPMAQLECDGQGWRQDIIDEYGDTLRFVTPSVDEDREISADASTAGDMAGIDRADVVLARLPPDVVTRGTAVEIWEASRHRDTPVVVWTVRKHEGTRPSETMRASADAWTVSLEGALEAVTEVSDRSHRIPEP